MCMRLILSSSFLPVGLLDRNRFGDSFGLGLFVKSEFALDHVLDRVNMLTGALSRLKIRATAIRLRRIGLDGVIVIATLAGLGRDKPSLAIFSALEFRLSGYY